MTKTRTRVDSAASKTKAKQAAMKPLPLPQTISLTPLEMIHYEMICDEFARVELTRHKVELIGNLARAMRRLTEEEETLDSEGTVSTGAQGGDILNPRVQSVEKLAQRIITMRRTLGIHAPAQGKKTAMDGTRAHNKANEREPSIPVGPAAEQRASLIARPEGSA